MLSKSEKFRRVQKDPEILSYLLWNCVYNYEINSEEVPAVLSARWAMLTDTHNQGGVIQGIWQIVEISEKSHSYSIANTKHCS